MREVVLLLHGIRTFAQWQAQVQRILEEIPGTKVVPLKYGYFDALRFWFPFATRRAPIEFLRLQIQNARAEHPDARISVIAHSFGSYAISEILLNNPDYQLHRLVICGSIIPHGYRWDLVRSRLATGVINDYGTRDIWPVLAKCLSWGYGDSGRHGFGHGATVMDRGHNFAHSDFFKEQFIRGFWKPWFEKDDFVKTQWIEEAPPPSILLSLLAILPLKWLPVAAAAWFLWSPPWYSRTADLAISVEDPQQVHPLIGANPTYGENPVFCGEMRLRLIAVHNQSQQVSIRLTRIAVEAEPVREAPKLDCKFNVMDMLGHGIVDVDTYSIKLGDRVLVDYVVDKDQTLAATPDNILVRFGKAVAFSVHPSGDDSAYQANIKVSATQPGLYRLRFRLFYNVSGTTHEKESVWLYVSDTS